MEAAAWRPGTVGPAGMIVGGIQPDGFVVRRLPFKDFLLRRRRSGEGQGDQECEDRCGFHSNDSIREWNGVRQLPERTGRHYQYRIQMGTTEAASASQVSIVRCGPSQRKVADQFPNAPWSRPH